LRVNFHAKNTGSGNMPFACGWHPYFGFPDTLLDKLEVKFASKSRFLSDSQMIPMREEAFDRSEPIALSIEKPDHVFRLKPMEKHVTELHDTQREISLYLAQSSIEFPFLVVFAIEDQNAVAIEPMTANTDAYNTGEGLLILTPDAQFESVVYLWVGKGSKAVR
jgi:aldose 1-epimerase